MAVFFNRANAHTVVYAIQSAELWPGPLWPAGPSWSLTAPAWLPYSVVYCGLLQPLLLPPKGHYMLLQPIWSRPKKRKAACCLPKTHETIQLSIFLYYHQGASYCTLCQANDRDKHLNIFKLHSLESFERQKWTWYAYRRTYWILLLISRFLPVPLGPWLWFSLFPRQAVEFVPPASFAGPPPLYASEQLEPEKRRKVKVKLLIKNNNLFPSTFKRAKQFFTCKLSWTRSASLLARADSKMLECSRRVLWDWASPASLPFSCSSSSASFLLASSNFRIRFLKHRDSWSCKINSGH